MTGLNDSIKYLKGVGEKNAEYLSKLDIFTPMDLLYHFPREYIYLTNQGFVDDIKSDEAYPVKATLVSKKREIFIRKGMTIYKCIFNDTHDDFTVTFFNNKYIYDILNADTEYILYGRVSRKGTEIEMLSPKVYYANTKNLIIPVYHLTDKIKTNYLQKLVKQALAIAEAENQDFLQKELLNENHLCTLPYALKNIHFPESDEAIQISKKRLAFNELLVLQLGLSLLKSSNTKQTGCKMKSRDISGFLDNLPFTPTNAQFKAIKEITGDMCGSSPMNRLLQGDVGSGKTLVAAAACYFSHANGYQSALMAPTEILSIQHYNTLKGFLEPFGIEVCLLTGSLTAKNKRIIKEDIESGRYSVVIGTHALLQKTTKFCKLGLVITDEQHRFGVNQRGTLQDKGQFPHTLVMSATPIPRTLALIIYGDLDISVLDEMPKGRIPIKTYAISKKMRSRAHEFVKKQLDMGYQGYIVCSLIDESESNLVSAKEYYDDLNNGFFKDYSVGLLHGKMSSDEKEKSMQDFKDGKTQLLVATTVIEVGVDVPNANIIVIENAERFGLSQLHQLRGRVGRGNAESYCVLIADSISQEIKERLTIMTTTTDGFKISEEDLKQRGCGDFFGKRQHGLPPLKIASFDSKLIALTKKCATDILKEDSCLDNNKPLQNMVHNLFKNSGQSSLN